MDKPPYVMAVNNGTLFVNDKGDNPRRPDFTGDANVDGVMYRVSLWKKTKKNNEKEVFLSLSFTKKDAPRSAPQNTRPAAKAVNDEPFHDDEKLPF